MTVNVLVLTHEYPPYMFGGVATYTQELVRYLRGKSHKVYVVAGNSLVITSGASKPEEHVYRVGFPDLPPRSLWYSIKAIDIVRKLIRHVDIIVANAGSLGLLPKFLRNEFTRRRVILIHHGTLESLYAYYRYVSIKDRVIFLTPEELAYFTAWIPYNYLIQKWELDVATYIVGVATHVIEELKNIFPNHVEKILTKSLVVYSGIDLELYSSIYETYRKRLFNQRAERQRTIFAYIGRLYLTKGVHYILRIAEVLREELSNKYEIWLFGEGPLKRYIRLTSEKMGLNIRFFGFVPREKLLKLVATNVSAVFLPSLYEGCPYVLIESNGLGIPVIAWNLPWTKEFIQHGVNGYLAAFPNVEDMAKYAIKSTYLDPDNIRSVALKYDKKTTFEKFEKIFEYLSL